MYSFDQWEDSADDTLTRLSSKWAGAKVASGRGPDLKVTGPEKFEICPIASSDNSQSNSIDEFKDTSAVALSRLSLQWSTGSDVSLHHIDEEMAPSLLVDWKLWSIKLAVLVFIPVALVAGGGVDHIAGISPAIAEYCHTQTLAIKETFSGKGNLSTADNHFSLAQLYHKRGDNRLAIEHANSAAKLYAYTTLKKCSEVPHQNLKQIGLSHQGILLGSEPAKLRDCLVIAAQAADQSDYHTLANKYWRHALAVEPGSGDQTFDVMGLLKQRIAASNSFAQTRQETDAYAALSGAFNLLPNSGAGSIYQGLRYARVDSTDLDAFRHAIDLHMRLASLDKKFKHRARYKTRKKVSATLKDHLVTYMALSQINQNWRPANPGMRDTLVEFDVSEDGWISNAVVTNDNYGVLKHQIETELLGVVWKNLGGNLAWYGSKKDDGCPISVRDYNFSPMRMRIVFTADGAVLPSSFGNEQIDSEYLVNRYKPHRDYVQDVLSVSSAL